MGRFNKRKGDLVISLHEIGESGWRISCRKSKEWIRDVLRDAGRSDCAFPDDITISIEVKSRGEGFSARGSLATAITLQCVRCLDAFTFPLEAQFHYHLCPSDSDPLLAEIEVRRDDLDVVHYEGTELDLVPLIVEQIMVTLPTYPLCGETCRGICQRCGENLNSRTCRCSGEDEKITAFEILRNFPLKQKP